MLIVLFYRPFQISIHAPREGGDPSASSPRTLRSHFNPRPPRGGRLVLRGEHDAAVLISIHAPREGGDCSRRRRRAGHPYFNPRPPRGGRRAFQAPLTDTPDFNPRPPRGGRPLVVPKVKPLFLISIHAPREGGDSEGRLQELPEQHFNPRPPRGGRRIRQPFICVYVRFQSTPPARGATASKGLRGDDHNISIHAPREGGDGRCSSADGAL